MAINSNKQSYTGVLQVTFIVLAFFSCVLTVSRTPIAQVKQEKQLTCQDKDGIASVFYNFKKLYIAYIGFRYPDPNDLHPDLRSKLQFPEILKYDNFNKRLIEEIKINFKNCLKNELGLDKQIIIIPPSNYIKNYEEQIETNKKIESEIHDPNNLTILIRVIYVPGVQLSAGKKEYGQAMYFIYRPEAPDKSSRLPLPKTSRTITFFPDDREQMEEVFEQFFSALRPYAMQRDGSSRGDLKGLHQK